MADTTTNGLLTITYTPHYPGCHRICFKTSGIEYCCYIDNSPSILGQEKVTEINLYPFSGCLGNIVPVSPGCDTVIVRGYIQPCCSQEGSDDNKVTFDAEFIPIPDPNC